MDNERLEAKGLGPSVGREGQARRSGAKAKHEGLARRSGAKAGREDQVRRPGDEAKRHAPSAKAECERQARERSRLNLSLLIPSGWNA